MVDVDIEAFLAAEGFLSTESAQRARAALEAAGLTHSRKRNLVVSKLDAARAVLRDRLLRVCHRPACRATSDPRERVDVSPANCQVCGGSANRHAGDRARDALRQAGYRHLLVLGGTPVTH